MIVEWRLGNLRQSFLVRLIQTLHLDVGVLNRLFISISISFFALPRRVLVVVLVEMHLEGWILFSLLLDQLEVIVTESTLRARRGFPAETASSQTADFLVTGGYIRVMFDSLVPTLLLIT